MLFFTACNEKLELIGTDYINGIVSEKEYRGGGCGFLYVSDGKKIQRLEVPNEIYNNYQKGDSCLLLIKKYKVKDEK